jgi:hypothetical protein
MFITHLPLVFGITYNPNAKTALLWAVFIYLIAICKEATSPALTSQGARGGQRDRFSQFLMDSINTAVVIS